MGPKLPDRRKLHCMAELSAHKVLIAGGMKGKPLKITRSTLILDLKEERYSKAADLGKLRSRHSCAYFHGKVYLVGKGDTKGETEIFQDGTWRPGPPFPEQINDQGSLVATQNDLFFSDPENFYKLSNGSWEPVYEAKILKSKDNFIPLTILTFQHDPDIENPCRLFSNLEP